MPIFQDDLARDRATPPAKSGFVFPNVSPNEVIARKTSEESIRTELCEGPIPDSPEDGRSSPKEHLEGFASKESSQGISNRVELIQRLKRGESPTWLPNRHLESMIHEYNDSAPSSTSNTEMPTSSPLLPAAEVTEGGRPSSRSDSDNLQAGLEIKRPRSALHSGDFTQERPTRDVGLRGQLSTPISSLQEQLHHNSKHETPPQSWLSTSPPRDYSPFQLDLESPFVPLSRPNDQIRSRAPSLSSSLSSTFLFKAPTSPLVQSQSNEDLEFSISMNPIDITTRSPSNSRRHESQSAHFFQSSPPIPSSSGYGRALPHLRRDNSFPYQAHQPRRSLTNNPTFPNQGWSPQTPGLLRSRRPSFTSESSPLQHASMVGSYEESILRGRMSTTPSKPLDFVAQIGVLGRGKCKSSLRCPAHVTIPFPAVFYSYGTTSHGRTKEAEDGPSPYVGQIDIENGLPNLEPKREIKPKRRNVTSILKDTADIDVTDPHMTPTPTERELRRAEKQKRRSTSPRAPPGGSYRIPEKGQLQIIIKNPNKTAVKLFLVPYDLEGMEQGTKTFIRQRIYSAGPIISLPVSSIEQPQQTTTPKDRPTLRYLIHLHICSPSRGRYYLYKSIRVVFANRVPDGKENLVNEIQLPEPKFSVYKPSRDSIGALGQVSGAGASLAAEKAFRRRSSGFPLSHSSRTFDTMDGITQSHAAGDSVGQTFPHNSNLSSTPVDPIPFSLFRRPKAPVEDDGNEKAPNQIQSPGSSRSSRPPTSQSNGMSDSWNSDSTGISNYGKLNKGDVGYGGNAFSGLHNGQQAVAEGLLARRLRGLDVGLPSNEQPLEDSI